MQNNNQELSLEQAIAQTNSIMTSDSGTIMQLMAKKDNTIRSALGDLMAITKERDAYKLRCDELSKENELLKKNNTQLKQPK
jgi:hypothetical protein